jgi:DNA polymerase-3 subunit epsilon
MLQRLKHAYKRSKLTNPAYQFLFEPQEEERFVSFDCETTGLNPKRDEILSIGAVEIVGDTIEINNSFERFVTPSRPISQESITIHHIRPCDMAHSIDPKEAISQFLHFIGNSTLIGYYVQFDIAMINRYAKPLIGTTIPNNFIELSQMYDQRIKKDSPYAQVDLRFDTILEQLHLPQLGQHDALNDAIMSSMIYLKLKRMREYRGILS